jgi:hypothetical protein
MKSQWLAVVAASVVLVVSALMFSGAALAGSHRPRHHASTSHGGFGGGFGGSFGGGFGGGFGG